MEDEQGKRMHRLYKHFTIFNSQNSTTSDLVFHKNGGANELTDCE